ncbi:MAG: potassium channel protein [Myxococcales bacterium]|nr:MAG: potassium channel protein [Myxococcales bacterium]
MSARHDKLLRHLYVAAVFLLVMFAIGSMGYFVLGAGRWRFDECLYMTIITVSTVGYAETLPGLGQVDYARLWTSLLILLGSGTLLYFASTFTAYIVEGDLRNVFRRKRMNKQIEELSNHIVVCGVGTTGMHVVHELIATKHPFVVIDNNEGRLTGIAAAAEREFPFVLGDATDDACLHDAGIERASGIVVGLHDDKDNLFVTISARALNPKLRIIAKAVELSAGPKLLRAGADTVVSPNYIGGVRMVSEMIRPKAVQFLDIMLRDKDHTLRVEEVTIPENSSLIGSTLRQSEIRTQANVLVIAVREPNGSYRYNPSAELELQAGMVLIVLVHTDDMPKLEQAVA